MTTSGLVCIKIKLFELKSQSINCFLNATISITFIEVQVQMLPVFLMSVRFAEIGSINIVKVTL